MSLAPTFWETLGGHVAGVLAYIGPGADLGLISSVIGLLLTLGASSVFLVLWPFRTLWRRIRGSSSMQNDGALTKPEST